MDDNTVSENKVLLSECDSKPSSNESSSYPQHIQENLKAESSLEDQNDYTQTESTTVAQQNNEKGSSATIHSVEQLENVLSQSHSTQETMSDNEQPTSTSHTESENMSSNGQFEQTMNQTTQDNNEVLNARNTEETSTNFNDQINEIKTQYELHTNDTSKAEVFPTQFRTDTNNDISTNEINSNINDTGVLTKTETPYEQNSIVEPLLNIVTEKIEQDSNDFVPQIEPDDILGNKSLLKQTIKRGLPDTRPVRSALATVSYKLYLIDDYTTDGRLIETITNESFFVGECDILPAIDITIQLMDRGEHAFIYSDIRHCYGDIGCEEKQIPATSSNKAYQMKIEIEFHDWKNSPDIQTLTVDERLFWSDKRRQRGNFSYRRKEYSTALQCYRGSLKFLDAEQYPLLEEEENDDKKTSLLIDRYIQVENNLAQVHLLNNQYEQCLEAVDKVLKYDSKNIKALFRQARAFVELGNYDQALPPLKFLQTQKKDVDTDKVNEMLNLCDTKLAKYKKNEKEIYKRMFSTSTAPMGTTTIGNEKSKTKNNQKVENKTNNTWWTYITMGSAVLAAIGLAAIIKYR